MRILLLILLIFPCFSLRAQKNIIKIGTGEYFVGYLTDENKIYSTLEVSQKNQFAVFPTLTNVIDVDGGQYTNMVLLGADSSVRQIRKGTNGLDSVRTYTTDANGNPFTGNKKVYGWFESGFTIRHDSIYYFGADSLRLNGSAYITAPMKLGQPAGKLVTKLVFADFHPDIPIRVLALCSDGTVYSYTVGSSTPTQVTGFTGPATNIATIGRAGYVIITATNIYAWGPYAGYFSGLSDGTTTPTSILSSFTSVGLVMPIKEAVGNWNTIHFIDANDNMFAEGDNVQGEIGNGVQYSDWRHYLNGASRAPFAWNFGRGQLMQTPVQIAGKWHNLCGNVSIAFYFYVQDCSNNWYAWGRDKNCALGNGLFITDAASFPDWGNVPTPTYVSPSTVIWATNFSGSGTACNVFTSCTVFDTAANQHPTASASVGQCITSSSVSITAVGSAQQAGTISTYAWTKISGTGGTITSPSSVNTTVTGLTTGSYIFRVTITNNLGLTNTDDVRISVTLTPSGGVGSFRRGGRLKVVN